ncbi:TVP38/TMEM64 family protein [Bhargavaea cecembensis]|uniref:TVP38/TMEM64 family protein n=1 Tax=Bhargavaea cecembensis TaxID=394098 RepID=UPI0005906EFC|nr:TVP38/TMEM64 family protein [Bhargavaea cecembensis]
MEDFFDIDTIIEISRHYRALGPLLGFLLPFVEAFLPFLPLFVFVIANATAYGFFFGFLLSWAGTVAGSYMVFLLIRRFGETRPFRFLTKSAKVRKLIHWVERNSFGPLFVLLCLPFTPSSLVNLVAGLSNMKRKVYLVTLMAGKFVMIGTASFIGYDLKALFTQPVRTAIVVVVIIILWYAGKHLEARLNRKVEADFREISEQQAAASAQQNAEKKDKPRGDK